MKRGLITLLIIAMLACIGLVSCKYEVQAPAEELVSVSFDKDSSRSLSSNLEKFEPEKYYWKYAAKKADGSNLISGQTNYYDVTDPTEEDNREAGAKWIKEGFTGFGPEGNPYRVPGFSQGLWNFTLYGYKWIDSDDDGVKDTDEFVLVYCGETTGVLLKSAEGYHTVSAVVSPVQGGNGTLWVKITGNDKITLDPAISGLIPNAKIKLGIDKLETTSTTVIRPLSFIDVDYEESLAAGTYKVTVQFTNDDGGVVYASGSVVATVYSGLKTTVKGNLTEVVTYADFGATQNPDIISRTAEVTGIKANDIVPTGSYTLEDTSASQTVAAVVTATIPEATAKALIGSDDPSARMSLALNVDTTDSTSTSVTYDISMTKTVTINSESTTSNVPEVSDWVTVEIDLRSGLTGVDVTHSGNVMAKKTSLDALNSSNEEAFYYDYDSGKLYIKTKTFSPFAVTYDPIVYVAKNATKNLWYNDLQNAIDEADNGDTINLLRNISFKSSESLIINKEITLNLGGMSITGSHDPLIVIGASAATYQPTSSQLTHTGHLTIRGEGSITSSNWDMFCVFPDATLDIYGGNYTGFKAAFYVYGGTLNTYGGTFTATSPNNTYIVQVKGAGSANIVSGNFSTPVSGGYGVYLDNASVTTFGSGTGTGPTFNTWRACIASNGSESHAVLANIYSGTYMSYRSDDKPGEQSVIQLANATTEVQTLNVYGGYFEQTGSNEDSSIFNVRYKGTININISGGQFVSTSSNRLFNGVCSSDKTSSPSTDNVHVTVTNSGAIPAGTQYVKVYNYVSDAHEPEKDYEFTIE